MCVGVFAVRVPSSLSSPLRHGPRPSGPPQPRADGRVVSNFIMQALSGEDITIYGDGGQTRSFCYVDDLIEGLVRLMNNEIEV